MKRIFYLCLPLVHLLSNPAPAHAQGFTLESVQSYPFTTGLTASAQGARIAWAFDIEGIRNVFVAEGPDFIPRQLTHYLNDDGQEITSLSISADGKWVVYVRGGDHNAGWDEDIAVNPSSAPVPPKVQIWSIAFSGGDPILLAEGDKPLISPKSDQVVYCQAGQVSIVPIDGSAPAKNLFKARGTNGSVEWSPDGSKLAFVSLRGDHSFIGVFTNQNAPIQWMAPAFSKDFSPRWSPDGSRLAFIRTPGAGGAPDSMLVRKHQPWSIWIVDSKSGKGEQLWNAPKTLAGSIPTSEGGPNLLWATEERIIFISNKDGWSHLYSITPKGGEPLLLTPGSFIVENIRLSPDRTWLAGSANTGGNPSDVDRRHIFRVPVDKASLEVLTPGDGLEWAPMITGDGMTVAYISATAQRPPLPTVIPLTKRIPKVLLENSIPVKFPIRNLITPRPIVFKSADGVMVRGQLFETAGGPTKKPAIVYVHGGPARQMLLGWHYSDYYSNTYSINQYLANLGFVVLSVNYRLGIGYGFEFNQPKHGGPTGAAEYQDIVAAGNWLASQPQVDPARIGIYGGSYGGFLTAMALSHDSKLFAAGVDIHGVHDWTIDRTRNLVSPDRFEHAPDADLALQIAWQSSPVSAVDHSTSPVLIIHGDDDRQVRFAQSTDLVKRLEEKNIRVQTLVIVDDTHHWKKHANEIQIGLATVEFLKKNLMK